MIKMTQIFEAIKNRRSVREYEDTGLPRGDIDLLLDAAVWAPSAMNRQPVRFVVIQNKELLKKLSSEVKVLVKMHKPEYKLRDLNDPIFYSAPVLIMLCAEKDYKWAEIDCALAAQNMMIAAYSIDIASCYIGFACLLNENKEIKKEMGIPEEYKIITPIIFGKAMGEYPMPKPRNAPEILNWIE